MSLTARAFGTPTALMTRRLGAYLRDSMQVFALDGRPVRNSSELGNIGESLLNSSIDVLRHRAPKP